MPTRGPFPNWSILMATRGAFPNWMGTFPTPWSVSQLDGNFHNYQLGKFPRLVVRQLGKLPPGWESHHLVRIILFLGCPPPKGRVWAGAAKVL